MFLGFIPVCSLGLSQVGRINLGQNVSSLRYFTICGLQEGFEPFAINMKRDITMWFSKSLPQFIIAPTDHPHIEVLYISVSQSWSSRPCMFSMFPCSSTSDSNEWVVLSLLQSLKT